MLPRIPWAKQEPESVQSKLERIRKYRGQFDLGIDYTSGIFSKNEQLLIGSTGLHTRLDEDAREIGYWINSTCLTQGFATESVSALIEVGFDIEQLTRIEIRYDPDNIASQGIPRKLGFLHEATLKNRIPDTKGDVRDMMIWTMFQEDYLHSPLTSFEIKAFDIAGELI